MGILTDGGRVLDRTERLLADYLDNDRQAVALAPYVFIPLGTPEEEQANVAKAVIQVLVDALEQSVGVSNLQYTGGQRRDTLREGK